MNIVKPSETCPEAVVGHGSAESVPLARPPSTWISVVPHVAMAVSKRSWPWPL